MLQTVVTKYDNVNYNEWLKQYETEIVMICYDFYDLNCSNFTQLENFCVFIVTKYLIIIINTLWDETCGFFDIHNGLTMIQGSIA